MCPPNVTFRGRPGISYIYPNETSSGRPHVVLYVTPRAAFTNVLKMFPKKRLKYILKTFLYGSLSKA